MRNTLLAVLVAVGALLLFSACGDDNRVPPASRTVTASPVPTPTVTASTANPTAVSTPSLDIVAAVRDYVGTTGLTRQSPPDSGTWQLTSPVGCMAAEQYENAESSPEDVNKRKMALVGKVCIAGSSISGTSAEVDVGPYSTDAVWRLSLDEEGGTWHVTSAVYVGL